MGEVPLESSLVRGPLAVTGPYGWGVPGRYGWGVTGGPYALWWVLLGSPCVSGARESLEGLLSSP